MKTSIRTRRAAALVRRTKEREFWKTCAAKWERNPEKHEIALIKISIAEKDITSLKIKLNV